jgi:hypothetical protein
MLSQNKSRIILISGKAQAGKTTTAEYLKSTLTIPVIEYSFADSLKSFCQDHFGLTYEQCYGTNDDKNTFTKLKWSKLPVSDWELIHNTIGGRDKIFMTAREVFEVFGSYICRWWYPDCWALATRNRIEKALK